MALGMPSPRLNAILGQFAIAVSAVVSGLLVIVFHDVPFLFLSVALAWIFTCLLFTSRFPLPGSMGSMVSGIGIFVFSQGTEEHPLRQPFFQTLGNYAEEARSNLRVSSRGNSSRRRTGAARVESKH